MSRKLKAKGAVRFMMITCPNCGAENRAGSPFCRMCAAALDATNAKAGAPNPYYQSPPAPAAPIACPACATMNEPDWAFCQECGFKMSAAAASPQIAPAPPRQATTDPVLSHPNDMATVVVKPLPPNAAATVVDNAAPRYHEPPPVAVAPITVSEEKPSAPPAPPRQPSPSSFKTVVQPPPQLTTAPDFEAVSEDPGAATVVDAGAQFAAAINSNEISCPKCAHRSAAGSMFCANCGGQLQASATIVMSSLPAQVKGKLHLVMEGGQPGEVYELKDETVIGRTGGDISFPHDGYMSGRHARVIRRGEEFILVDEGSRNGTFVRIKKEVKLEPGDMVLIGKQLFRFEQ